MFTGIVESLGVVVKIRQGGLTVRARLSPRKGDSIAVDGVCLTVTGVSGSPGRRLLAFDVSPETSAKTTLGSLRPGSRVNLEPAARVGSPLGGHLVMGHVEGTAQLVSKTPLGGSAVYEFTLPLRLRKYVVSKGCVTVDGISLTPVEVKDGSFTVAVVPHTERHTALGLKKPGDSVNLETDILAKYVESLLNAGEEASGGGLFVKKTVAWGDLLREEGYE
jgi:riboflavin synthase